MKRPQLVEFARQRLAEGTSRAEIEEHLRGQNWGEDVIAEVMQGADPALPPITQAGPLRKHWLPWVAAGLALLLLAGGFFAWRHFASAQAIRALVTHVSFEGDIRGQLEGSDRTLELVQFRGALDTSDLARPKASMKLELDRKGKTGKDLKNVSPATDARFMAAALMSIAAGGKFLGGADLRFAEENVFFHLDRTPFSAGGDDALMAIVGALAGPQIAANPWVRIPAGPAGTSESQAALALLFRPTDQVFGSSKELRFTGKESGEDIDGTPTEIHRYVLNGKWLSKELRRLIRETAADENMAIVGMIQGLATGKSLPDTGSAVDSLTCADGEMKVWVGRQDTLPRRIVLETRVSEGTRSPLSLSLRGEIRATYGKTQAIDFPADSVTLEELKKSGPFSQFF
ncbi:MAG: hypothetical protein ACO3XN_02785 [Chthoniobacterales bacterium]